MNVTARLAVDDDLPALVTLYRGLEAEMTALHPMWPLADGLVEPIEDSLLGALSDPDSRLVLGEIDGYPFGFLLARIDPLLPQASGERIGSIRLVYVEDDAREVSVGEVMRDSVLESLRGLGITKFDAYVLPGHRLAKNFFEAGGFSARLIVMHHDDERG